MLAKALEMHRLGQLSEADKIYLEILKHDSDNYDANHLHGLILSQNKEYAKAVTYFSNAHNSGHPTCELLNNHAIALRNLQAYTECEQLLLDALKKDKYFANTYKNLSNCYLSKNEYKNAIDILEKAINLSLQTEDMRLKILDIFYIKIKKEKNDDDIKKYKRHLLILSESQSLGVKAKCALRYFHLGEIIKALNLFKDSEKHYSNSIPSVDTLKKLENKNIIKSFVKHEYEQITHIDSDKDGIRNMKISQEYYNNLNNVNSKSITEYNDEDYKFISSLHTIKYNKPPKIQKNYINKELKFTEIENKYINSDPEIVVIDNFLTESFLNELNIFFRCANIFKYPYSRGYIGAFLGKGMANKALLEFSQDLKKSFKKIFMDYDLSQAWAFKYDSKREGIGIHADDAKINVNFWVTDDSSNLNSETGGMIIWKRTPPSGSDFQDYNSISSMDKMFKEVKNTDSLRISYKANRAIIFNSNLYHVTDELHFRDSYEDRRVNVTFLYK